MSVTTAALNRLRPFTRSDALAAGISPKQLRGSRFRRIFSGVYIEARVPDHPLIRAEAALLLHPPGAFASHVTAGLIHGVPLPSHPLTHVTVLHPDDRRRSEGIRCHVSVDREVERISGVPVSGPHQMFVELASMLSLVDLVVVGDALVRMGKATPASLAAYCERSDARHTALALRAARYVRGEVDSPMESRLRMLIVMAGLPEPVVNHKIRDQDGRVIRRFDLSYPSVRLIVEYDGRQHVEVVDNWQSDLVRREELDDAGWRILVVTSAGIYKEPGRTVSRIHQALRKQGWRGLAPRPGDAWRQFFPERSR
jgi:very-short-patch-repair endonuclease